MTSPTETELGVAQAPEAGPGARIPAWALGLLLVVSVLAAYQRTWHFGFIWDDDAHLTANPCIVGPEGLKEIWTTSSARTFPLVLTTFWAQHKFWGLDPRPYHLFTVAMHAAAAVVLWRVLRSLRVPGAWLGAALWALHPVQVESVAWITELKNTQSGFFFLLTVLFFVKGHRSGWSERWRYPLTLLWFLLALASKSATVVMPVVLALSAWWIDGRWRWRTLGRLTPLFLFSLASGLLSVWSQTVEGGNVDRWARGGLERFASVGKVVWFYLGKLAWPDPLIFIYPRWATDPARLSHYLATLALLAALLALWLARRTRWRSVLFASAYFVVALFPVLGLLDHYFWRYSFVGDHFQYLASMGPLALLGALLARGPRRLVPVWSGSALLVLGTLTWRQSALYVDDETLWGTTVRLNPDSWLAHNNLGTAFVQQGRLEEAQREFERALELWPDHAMIFYNLGNVLSRAGKMKEAVAYYQKALDVDPGFATQFDNPQYSSPEVQFCVGRAFQAMNMLDQAIVHYQRALELDPDHVDTHYSLGFALRDKGQPEPAMAHWQRVVALDPKRTDAREALGSLLAGSGRLQEAAQQYREALRIGPENASLHYGLAQACHQLELLDEALLHYRAALALDAGNVEARTNLAGLLTQTGQSREAVAEFGKVLEFDPRCLPALNNLAWLLATSRDDSLRDGARAVRLASLANELSAAANPLVLRTLGAAHAESGDARKAAQAIQSAIRLASAQGAQDLVQELRSNLALFESGRPYREPAQ